MRSKHQPGVEIAPASARNTAVTAGRRWKGRVTAARNAPSSTLQQRRGAVDGMGSAHSQAGPGGATAAHDPLCTTLRAHLSCCASRKPCAEDGAGSCASNSATAW